MSVITTVFDYLAQNENVRAILGNHALAQDYPGIYDVWAIEDVPMPYLVLSYSFDSSEETARQEGSLIIDIFTQGSSTIQAETIRNELREILDYQILFSEGEGTLRIHYLRDSSIPEPEDNIVHWMIEFSLIFWDASLIQAINKRG